VTLSGGGGTLAAVAAQRHVCIVFAAVFVVFALVPSAFGAQKRSSAATLLQAVNATRAAHGLRPLRFDARLQTAARLWSSALLRRNAFTHGDFASRMRAFHIFGLSGENLAWGSGSYAASRTVVAMWLASPGHRANLLSPAYRRIGIGIARGTFLGHGGASVVTADFAR
jgi:uncharacterized protein YkwD